MSGKRPVEDMIIDLAVQAEILELYKRKKTPDGRRDCIKAMAKQHGLKEREIAEFLLDQGCQVDGRLVRNRKARAVAPPLPEMPGWDGPEEVVAEKPVPAPEPAPAPEPEPAPPVCMTAGCLREVLSKVAPGADVYIDGNPLRSLHVTVCFGQDGDLTDSAVFLERE